MPSVGMTVKLSVPADVGVPVTVTVPVPSPVMARPVLLLTLPTASAIGPLPPEPVIDWLYATPASPSGRRAADGVGRRDGGAQRAGGGRRAADRDRSGAAARDGQAGDV